MLQNTNLGFMHDLVLISASRNQSRGLQSVLINRHSQKQSPLNEIYIPSYFIGNKLQIQYVGLNMICVIILSLFYYLYN